MPTQAIDLGSIAHALELYRLHESPRHAWIGADNHDQQEFLDWFNRNRHFLHGLPATAGLCSSRYYQLNRWIDARLNLTDPAYRQHHFQPFLGLGVASILKVAPYWSCSTAGTTIRYNGRSYQGFTTGARVFRVEDWENPVVRLETTAGQVWLSAMNADRAPYGTFGLMTAAYRVFRPNKEHDTYWSDVSVPKLHIYTNQVQHWLAGLSLQHGNAGAGEIRQGRQLLRFHIGHQPHVRSISQQQGGEYGEYILNQPFLGFLIRPGSRVPTSVFYADVDSWR